MQICHSEIQTERTTKLKGYYSRMNCLPLVHSTPFTAVNHQNVPLPHALVGVTVLKDPSFMGPRAMNAIALPGRPGWYSFLLLPCLQASMRPGDVLVIQISQE
jgi:hypothetical protein